MNLFYDYFNKYYWIYFDLKYEDERKAFENDFLEMRSLFKFFLIPYFKTFKNVDLTEIFNDL